MKTVVVILPTYNEAKNIQTVLKTLEKVVVKNKKYHWAVLVVDDNSPDGTAEIVRSYKSQVLKVKLLPGKKQGLGIAMSRGISFALNSLRPDIVITNEADMAYDPRYIPAMLKKISSGYDVVIASRHLSGGKVEGWTFNRTFHHFVANTLFATWLAGVSKIKDHNGAFRAVRVKGVMDQIDWNNLDIKGFGFFNYWCYLLTTLSPNIYEFPVTYKFRTEGESKVSFNPKYLATYLRDVIEYIALCFKIRFTKTKPLMKPAKINTKTLETIWNSVPKDYYQTSTKTNPLQYLWHSGKLKAVAGQLPKNPKSILDVGCASGWFLSQLKNKYPQAKCTGVDVYSKAVVYGKKLYPNLILKTADVHHLPFPANSFDVVICTEVLEHVVDPIQVLKEIKRVAKPKSSIVIEMDSGNWLFNTIWAVWTKSRGAVWHDAHIQKFDATILKQAIETSGLTIAHTQFFNFSMGVVYSCTK